MKYEGWVRGGVDNQTTMHPPCFIDRLQLKYPLNKNIPLLLNYPKYLYLITITQNITVSQMKLNKKLQYFVEQSLLCVV